MINSGIAIATNINGTILKLRPKLRLKSPFITIIIHDEIIDVKSDVINVINSKVMAFFQFFLKK
jgi:hypothetical protein